MNKKLIYSGVDWKKVALAQSKNWQSKNGPVVVTKKTKDTNQ
jgi:hypothetical protein